MQLAVVSGVGALGGVGRVDDVRRAALAAAVAVQVRVVRLAGDARGGVLPLGAVEREVVRADALVGGKRAALVAALAGTEEAARGVGGGVFGREPRPCLEARQRGVDRVEVNCVDLALFFPDLIEPLRVKRSSAGKLLARKLPLIRPVCADGCRASHDGGLLANHGKFPHLLVPPAAEG